MLRLASGLAGSVNGSFVPAVTCAICRPSADPAPAAPAVAPDPAPAAPAAPAPAVADLSSIGAVPASSSFTLDAQPTIASAHPVAEAVAWFGSS